MTGRWYLGFWIAACKARLPYYLITRQIDLLGKTCGQTCVVVAVILFTYTNIYKHKLV